MAKGFCNCYRKSLNPIYTEGSPALDTRRDLNKKSFSQEEKGVQFAVESRS